MSVSNDQIIYNTALKYGFTPDAAKFVVAQARFESADYTSNVFKANNNTSGMKYVGQPLATRGTIAPKSEQSTSCRNGGKCYNGDFYAKFNSIQDSVEDKIGRLYNITKGGVSPQQLKNAKTPEEFAKLLKKRGYYTDKEEIYARGLKNKLLKIEVIEFVNENRNYLSLGIVLVLIGLFYYYKSN